MNLSLDTTTSPALTSSQIINDIGQGTQAAITGTRTADPRTEGVQLAQAPFNINQAAVLISSLSQNNGKVEGLQITKKDTQRDLTQNNNGKETDIFNATFQGTPITIRIEKYLINTAYGSNDEKIGIPNSITIESASGNVTRSSEDLGTSAYIGEGKLNTINFNLNKLVPKETK
jgi:hypothetical protein